MSNWVSTLLVPLAIALGNVAVQFYFKLVPDRLDILQHLTTVGWWALDIFSVGIQSHALYRLANQSGPVTSHFVVEACVLTCCELGTVVLIIFRRFTATVLGRSSSHVGRIVDTMGWHLNAIQNHEDALLRLADDPALSADTAEDIRAIVRMRGRRPQHVSDPEE